MRYGVIHTVPRCLHCQLPLSGYLTPQTSGLHWPGWTSAGPGHDLMNDPPGLAVQLHDNQRLELFRQVHELWLRRCLFLCCRAPPCEPAFGAPCLRICRAHCIFQDKPIISIPEGSQGAVDVTVEMLARALVCITGMRAICITRVKDA